MSKTAVEQILEELPELLEDYKHLALDADGNLDPIRRRRSDKLWRLLIRAKRSQNGLK